MWLLTVRIDFWSSNTNELRKIVVLNPRIEKRKCKTFKNLGDAWSNGETLDSHREDDEVLRTACCKKSEGKRETRSYWHVDDGTTSETLINLTEVVRKGGINHEVSHQYRKSGERKKHNQRTDKLQHCVGLHENKIHSNGLETRNDSRMRGRSERRWNFIFDRNMSSDDSDTCWSICAQRTMASPVNMYLTCLDVQYVIKISEIWLFDQ